MKLMLLMHLLNLLLQMFLKDISTFKQQQLLDAEKIKQAMPNAKNKNVY